MDIKVKTLLTISFVTFFVAGCSNTDGRYAVGNQVDPATNAKAGVKHTHNGVAHTHPLPEGGLSHSHNYNSSTAINTNTCTPCNAGSTPVVNIPVTTGNPGSSGNCHVHNGRRHCHPLPASGTNHVHRQGQATVATQPEQQTQPAVVQPATTVVQPPQQPVNTTYYDYSGGSASTTDNTSYYNYGGGGSKGNAAKNQVTHSHNGVSHSHALPAAGINHTHNQGSTSIGNTYSTASSGSGGSTGNGNFYIVKPKDTVFQVMRNTGTYWKTIIKLNNLQAPDYTIVPGQRLRLK